MSPDTPPRDEAGVTLIELGITMLLLGIVLAMVVQVMVSMQSIVGVEAGRSAANDRLSLGVRALERQLRSGEVVGDPATESDVTNEIFPGMSVRVRTQSTGAVAAERCAQWRIDDDGELEVREWSPNWLVDGDYTGFRIVADGVANRTATPAVDAFTRSTTPQYSGRVLEIRLLARGTGTADTVKRIETSVTGRGAIVGNAPSTACDSLPPY